jgi:hypothetical protein
MSAKYQSILTELTTVSTNTSPAPLCPYDPLGEWTLQLISVYRLLLRAKRTRHRINTLIYAYYLGQLLENAESPAQRTSGLQTLTKYYAGVAVRTYYIFSKWDISQVYHTTTLTLRNISQLKFAEYQLLI